MWCQGGHLFLIFFCASHLPPAPATSPAHTINSLRQMMDRSQATAIKLEALKDVYNDPPRGTVKTIITDDEQVVDFVKIEEQPAFDHPFLKDHKIQMKPSCDPIELGPRPNENAAKPLEFAEEIPEGTVPIFRSRKGNFRKTTGPAHLFLSRIDDQSAGTTTSTVQDANENEAE